MDEVLSLGNGSWASPVASVFLQQFHPEAPILSLFGVFWVMCHHQDFDWLGQSHGGREDSGVRHRTQTQDWACGEGWYLQIERGQFIPLWQPVRTIPTRKVFQNLWHNHRKVAMCSCETSLLLPLLRRDPRKGEGLSAYMWGRLGVAGRPGEFSWDGDICAEFSLGGLDKNIASVWVIFALTAQEGGGGPSRSQDLQIKPPYGETRLRGILMRECGAVVMLAFRSLRGSGFANPCCPLYHSICWPTQADNMPQRVSKIPIGSVLLPSPPSSLPPVPAFVSQFRDLGMSPKTQLCSVDTWRSSQRDLRPPLPPDLI